MKIIVYLVSVITLCLAWHVTAYSQDQTAKPVEFHPQLGEMIDAVENARYRIFGEIEGFSAARLYAESTGSYRLHLLRNLVDGGQVLIRRLNTSAFVDFTRKLERRIGSEAAPLQALYPIKESRWPQEHGLGKIYLRDGSMINGTIRSVLQDTLIVETSGGLVIPVPDAMLTALEMSPAGVPGSGFYRSDPNVSRLFFAPTGRPLKRGQGYFADYFLFFPTLAVGFSDYFSLSGGVSLLPGADSQLLYFAPKITVPLHRKLGMSFGALHLAIPEEADDLTFGYGVLTTGTAASAFTVGAGLPLTANDRALLILLGGETQISNSAKLISENWIITGDDDTLLFSIGVRFFGDKLAVDLALFSTDEAFDGGGWPFAPWVDFSVFWGR